MDQKNPRRSDFKVLSKEENIKLIEKDPALFSGYRVNNYILKDDGSFCRFISFDDEGDRWQVLSPDILLETVANLESVGETLVLTVTAVKDWDSEYYTTDADIRTILTIDARTLEILEWANGIRMNCPHASWSGGAT